MRKLLGRILALGLRGSTSKWLVLASLVGLICGSVGLLFYWSTETLVAWLVGNPQLTNYQEVLPAGELHVGPPHEHAASDISAFWLVGLLVLGGLVSGLLTTFIDRDAAGAGTGTALKAFHEDNGHIRLRTVFVKFFATLATYTTGGSAGREGPIALISAGLASTVGRYFHLTSRDRRILLMAGVAGGVAALFRAPLAGAFFAAEVLYRDPDLEADALIPGFISAVVAYCAFGILFALVFPHGSGEGVFLAALFATPEMHFAVGDVGELLGYLVVAIVLALVCYLHVRTYLGVERHLGRAPVPLWLKPAIGALGTGLVALVVLYGVWGSGLLPSNNTSQLAVLGAGYGILQQALDGSMAPDLALDSWSMCRILLIVAIGKLVTQSLTVGSGGSGGSFGPSVVIGGCLGGGIGYGLQAVPWLPAELVPEPTACVIIGMAGYLAVAYKAPVTALLMITDLTGSFSMLLPGMWVCTLAYLFGNKAGIVHGQVGSPLESPAHRGHFFNDILGGIKVAQVFDPDRVVRTLKPSSSIDACKRLVTESHQNVYPVVDEDGSLHGLFNLNDLRSFLYDDALGLVAVAEDVASTDLILLRRQDSLATALRRFTERNLEELPVVEDFESRRFIGLLTRREVIAAYNQAVQEIRAQRQADGYEDPVASTAARQDD